MIDAGRLERALQTARQRLLAERTPEGHWRGHLSSSALATAVAVIALKLGGDAADASLIRAGSSWLADNQNPDGGFGDTPDSPSNLSTSLLVASAWRIADAPPARESVARLEEYLSPLVGTTSRSRSQAVTDLYGEDRTFAVPILMTCALAGLAEWTDIPSLPFELAMLPRAAYRAVRMEVVSYALPALIAVGVLLHHKHPTRNPLLRALRTLVAGPAVRRLVRLQPASGGFLEATPLTAFTAMSLVAAGHAHSPVVAAALGFLRASVREDGSWPIDTDLAVWVTTLAQNALTCRDAGAGLATSGERSVRETMDRASSAGSDGIGTVPAGAVTDWLLAQQQRTVHPFTGARPGGWAWTDHSGGVPDADDTAGALLALASAGTTKALCDGARWLLGLQNADGGWPTFCRGWGRLPFDRSCADITAHVLRALVAVEDRVRLAGLRQAVRRGLRYLADAQCDDGSWIPLWFGNQQSPGRHNPVVGTSRVLAALAHLERESHAARRGLEYLLQAQNPDGGWGGAAGVPSSMEETALAVSVLTQWPEETQAALSPAIHYLVRRVEDGSWVQASPIGLYFASLWYSERLYPIIWTVEALSRFADCSAATVRNPS